MAETQWVISDGTMGEPKEGAEARVECSPSRHLSWPGSDAFPQNSQRIERNLMIVHLPF